MLRLRPHRPFTPERLSVPGASWRTSPPSRFSLESAQQKVDLSVLEGAGQQAADRRVIDLSDESPVEDVETIASRIRNALKYVDAERLILPGLRYEVPVARESVRQALGAVEGG